MLSGCRRSLTLLALVAVVGLAAGCQVDTEVELTVEPDGSGAVEVTLALDEAAVDRVPDIAGDGGSSEENLADLIRTADLEEAGWSVDGPEAVDGGARLVLQRPFGTPEEAAEILGQLAPDVVSDVEVTRSTSVGVDEYAFSGTADLSGGLEMFSDDGVAEVLGGVPLGPLGEDPAALEERVGGPVDEAFELDIAVVLPELSGETWSPELGGAAVPMEASSTVYDTPVIAAGAFALLCLVALVLLLIVRGIRSLRH